MLKRIGYCKCGCGTTITERSKTGYTRGHNLKKGIRKSTSADSTGNLIISLPVDDARRIAIDYMNSHLISNEKLVAIAREAIVSMGFSLTGKVPTQIAGEHIAKIRKPYGPRHPKKHQRWTPEDIEYVKQNYYALKNHSLHECRMQNKGVAKHLGRTMPSLYTLVSALGLTQ